MTQFPIWTIEMNVLILKYCWNLINIRWMNYSTSMWWRRNLRSKEWSARNIWSKRSDLSLYRGKSPSKELMLTFRNSIHNQIRRITINKSAPNWGTRVKSWHSAALAATRHQLKRALMQSRAARILVIKAYRISKSTQANQPSFKLRVHSLGRHRMVLVESRCWIMIYIINSMEVFSVFQITKGKHPGLAQSPSCLRCCWAPSRQQTAKLLLQDRVNSLDLQLGASRYLRGDSNPPNHVIEQMMHRNWHTA